MVDTYSYVNMILLSVIGGIFACLLIVLGWWAKDIRGKYQKVSDTIDIIMKSIGDVATDVSGVIQWSRSHDKSDDERHGDVRRGLDQNRQSIHDVRNQLSDIGIKRALHHRRPEGERLDE